MCIDERKSRCARRIEPLLTVEGHATLPKVAWVQELLGLGNNTVPKPSVVLEDLGVLEDLLPDLVGERSLPAPIFGPYLFPQAFQNVCTAVAYGKEDHCVLLQWNTKAVFWREKRVG